MSEVKSEPAVMIDATSDARIVNNVMRHEYRVLTSEEKSDMKHLKDLGEVFLALCDRIGVSQEMHNAKTRMEEAVMWAVKHVTK